MERDLCREHRALTAGTLGRILRHSHVIQIKGDSYRLRETPGEDCAVRQRRQVDLFAFAVDRDQD